MADTDGPPTAAGLFGSGSDGGMRMWDWLEVMCEGCKHETVAAREDGTGPGVGCEIADGACLDPYSHPVPEWKVPATPGDRPERIRDQLDDGPWPVCTAYEPRKERSDKGLRRGPRVPGDQLELLGRGEVA